ncbi:MAG: PEGA domain-containing protein [Treponema sp.]|nr:PEGA domain-containing protein [Treponema sp.]
MNKIISVAVIAAFFSACQTTTLVNINTNVPGAQVVLDGKIIGATPINDYKVKNSAGKKYQVIIEKEGYEPVQRNLQTETKTANQVAVVIGYAFGILILPAFLMLNALWMEGPVPDQYFILEKSGS